jgi:xanthine dehydrogenase accessory factor
MGLKAVEAFLRSGSAPALIEVTVAKGSTPREAGAWMLVSPEATFGTIGGGQLEFLAIAKARELIAANLASGTMNIPLGPEIGQCCGGRVELAIDIVDEARRETLLDRAAREDEARPRVYLFGGGHVGLSLAGYFALLPVRTIVVETRPEALEGLPPNVEGRLTSIPEAAVRDAPPGSVFVVLTHDHALDFLIVAEALKRGDAAYVGMIGSRTKRETFRRWYLREAGGDEARFAQLVSPIGGDDVDDKRPQIIAALAAAEIVRAIHGRGGSPHSSA